MTYSGWGTWNWQRNEKQMGKSIYPIRGSFRADSIKIWHETCENVRPPKNSERLTRNEFLLRLITAMPRIFDNIEKELLPALQETIKLSDRVEYRKYKSHFPRNRSCHHPVPVPMVRPPAHPGDASDAESLVPCSSWRVLVEGFLSPGRARTCHVCLPSPPGAVDTH
jgi:hypothetical protein